MNVNAKGFNFSHDVTPIGLTQFAYEQLPPHVAGEVSNLASSVLSCLETTVVGVTGEYLCPRQILRSLH